MKTILSLLMVALLTGCALTKTYYVGTEHSRKKDCSILSRTYWTCTITHVDNVPTNMIQGSPDDKLYMTNCTSLRLKPGNHSIKYSYCYKIYLRSNFFNTNPFITEEGKSVFAQSYYLHKEGVINHNFEKGKKYTMIVLNETSGLNGQEHDQEDWESICNKYISVSIR